MMKRVFKRMAIAVIAVFTMGVTGAFAQRIVGNLRYLLSADGTCSVSAADSGISGHVTIPSEVSWVVGGAGRDQG